MKISTIDNKKYISFFLSESNYLLQLEMRYPVYPFLTWSHSSKSLKKKVVSATSNIMPSIVWAKSNKILGSLPYFEANDPVNKVWNKINVSSKSQINTRSTWDSKSGLWLFLLFALRLFAVVLRAEIILKMHKNLRQILSTGCGNGVVPLLLH